MFGRLLRQPLDWVAGHPPEPSDNEQENNSQDNKTDDGIEDPVVRDPYEPTVLDVLVIKTMLNKAFNLPPEIVDSIVELAEYWPHTSTEIIYTGSHKKNAQGSRPGLENLFLLRTPPLGFVRPPYNSPQDIETAPPPQTLDQEFDSEDFRNLIGPPVATTVHPCRKIVFTTVSRDQGWGTQGRGTYDSSWTWFEVGLERCNKKSPSSAAVEQRGSTDANDNDNTRDTSPGSEPEYEIISSSTPASSSEGAAPPPRPSFDLSALATLNPPVQAADNTTEAFFNHPLLPRENCKIQCNVTADREFREHRVVWSYTDDIRAPPATSDADADADVAADADSPEVKALEDVGRGKVTGDGEFVRNLKLGDIVTVWTKARFPGWANYLERVKVDVYWAI